jgi:DNA-binding LytR/AlgR family response regulator
MQVIIVEDERPAAKALEKLLHESDAALTVATVLDSVSSAVSWLRTHPAPDLVFMDIQLGDGLSFEIFEQTHISCPVIFTTAYNEYAIRAFKHNSIDYLLKPVNPSELAHSLEKFHAIHVSCEGQDADVDYQSILKSIKLLNPSYKSRFLVPFRDQFISIPVEEISHFSSANKNTFLVTRDQKKHHVDFTLEHLEEELDPRTFFRVNRQFIISYPSIAAVHSFFNGKLKIFVRSSDEEIVISRERAAPFKAWLDR